MKRGKSCNYKPDENFIKEVELLGGHGMTLDNLRHYYRFKNTAWFKFLDKNPAVIEALINGRLKTGLFVAQCLLDQVKKGSVAAMIFYLKTQMRWTEHSTIGVTTENKNDVIPLKLGNDPVKAVKAYQKIMR